MTREEQVSAIASAFAEVLREWLSTAEMAEVRHRNVAYAPGICASHDFCDANMAMLPAFERVMGHEPEAESEEDAALWSAAWDEAKRLYLTD